MTDKTTTERLRELLDERGVEYQCNEGTKVFYWDCDGANGGTAWFTATKVDGGINMIASNLTPEQAVEITLGRGTCHDIGTFKSWGLFTCSNCSIVIPLNAAKDAPRVGKSVPLKFCPNCGAKVVEE